MVTVGVFVRARAEELGEVAARLAGLEGVSTLELEQPGTLGLVIEAPDLDAVHARLRDEVQPTEGVLAAWPVHTELGNPPDRTPAPR